MSYLHHCSSPLTVLGLLCAPLSAYSAITTHLISPRVEKRTSAGTEVFTAKRQSSRPQLEWGRMGAPLGWHVSPFLVLQQPQPSPHRSMAEPWGAELHTMQILAASCMLKCKHMCSYSCLQRCALEIWLCNCLTPALIRLDGIR